MLHLHLTTCFNLLDAIGRQTDRDAMLRAQCLGVGGWLSMCFHQRVCIYIRRVSVQGNCQWCQTFSSCWLHRGMATAPERLIQQPIDCLIGSLIGSTASCPSAVGVSEGSGVEGVLKCFIESGLIDSAAKRYRQLFPLLPAWSRWALWAHMQMH